MHIPPTAALSQQMLQSRETHEEALREAARALEANFLAVMLKAAGLGAPRESFGGGIGEEQLSSFLAEAHAAALVRRGGIGLSESLFRALKERVDAPR